MHLFFDTVWKLHIGEIPEKPDPKNYLYPGPLVSDLKQYENTIAAIKQNALTVGNPILCPQNMSAVEPGKFYEWIGGYDIVGMGTVAILTLPEEKTLEEMDDDCAHAAKKLIQSAKSINLKVVPEEKKNTMENMTKERAKEIVAKKYGLGTTLVTGHKASYWEEAMDLVLASGSVAAPKEEYEVSKLMVHKIQAYEQLAELASLRQQLETLRGFVKEVDASLYHGPDLEDKEIMQHYIEVFKIIKEEARKTLSK